MAIIHRTTAKPTKLELLTSWLPSRRWYAGSGAPALANGGGFRLDDPEGEVGIEFMVIPGPHGVTLRLHRVLRGSPDTASVRPPEAAGHVAGSWHLPDGTRARGTFVVVRRDPRT